MLFGSDLCRTAGLFLPDDDADDPDLVDFYACYWRYFETGDTGLPHPFPAQGDWTIDGIALSGGALHELYRGAAQRVLVDPWEARRAGG